jgi:hypothetical protein
MNISHFLPVNPYPIYQHFNAQTDWQKKRIDLAIDLYRNSLVDCLIEKLQFQEADLYQIAHDDFVKRCGQVTIYGSKTKLEFANVMKQFSEFYNVFKSGNSIDKKVSFVTLNFNLKQLIKTKNSEELLVQFYKDVDITDPSVVDITPIDMKSLDSYIKANKQYHKQNETIKEYLAQAETIQMISELTNGVFPQVINESDFGRRYYKGFNLQNTSKVVRNASLGDNYEYDLNTAVYAVKLNFASDITDKKFTYTSEYIEGGGKYKDNIRKRLTKHCFDIDETSKFFKDRLKIIKQAITAIGFGATSTGHGFFDKKNNNWKSSSLSEIFSFPIKNHDGSKKLIELTKTVNGKKVKSLDLFLQDTWMSEFIKEQQEMTKLIVDFLKSEKFITKEQHPFLVDGRNAINQSKAIAYFFQKTERNIMDVSAKYMEDNGAKVLLRVHDAIYTDKKVKLGELHLLLSEKFVTSNLSWLGTKIISFEETFNQGYYFDDEDESDIDEQFSKLTGVPHVKPVVKLQHNYKPKQIEGLYDGSCDFGQNNYDPENDPYIQDMNQQAREEHYRIVGYTHTSNIPKDILDIMD